MTQPDILFIVLDTQRRDRLSLYGGPRETSPALDDFARNATVFERAVAPAQWTMPSHASMFTGLHVGTHGVIEVSDALSGMYPTLAEILQADGYRTVGFCNNPLVGLLNNNLTRGFDAFYNYAGASPSRPRDVNRGAVRRALSTGWRRFAHRVQNQFAQNDTLFRLSLHPWLVSLWTRAVNYKGHTEHTIDDAIDTMRAHHAGGADAPLFTFINLMGTHMPYRPPQSYVDRVVPELRRDKAAYRFMGRFNDDAARWASPTEQSLTEWELDVLKAFYDAEIAYQDDHVGRLLRDLQASGRLDNTMVVVVADHGEAHGDHGFMGHSFVVYQELEQDPQVNHFPGGLAAGKHATTNVSTRRLFHTMLDAAGVAPPLDEADPNANVARLSLAAATNGVPDIEGNTAFVEAFPPNTFLNVLRHRNPAVIDTMNLRQVRRGVYDGAHKLTTVGTHVDGLFYLNDDPDEVRSVAAQNPALTQAMQQKLDAFAREVAGQRTNGAAFEGVNADVEDHLRALGYIE